ncbi:transmembrane protein, putative [Entamoeba histolytica HM-3:IMSS]|uniref:Transmembrane protein, putative n=1 Tax=Entamoeba histolytica HM-3:IMSS TaxID=885315 RepID=M7WED9_ENTHI|nr:transmembrane protein, putative [Entamoeba histolytica HM-3:IMSS]
MTDDKNVVLGYICVIIAVLFFGSNFTVTKKFPTSDGIFFQWVMCVGILLVGIFTMLFNGVLNDGPVIFEPFAMLGGLIWCTGNLFCIPIIQLIGLSLGPGIWGVANMVMGWLTGTFGWFGLNSDKENIKIFWLNCIGAILVGCSVPGYALIKTSPKLEHKTEEKTTSQNSYELNETLVSDDEEINEDSTTQIIIEDENFIESENKEEYNNKKIKEKESPISLLLKSMPKYLQMVVGVICSLIAGILFGSAFNPSKYLQDNRLSSPNGVDYVFSHFVGIFLASTLYFIIYIIIFRNKPFIFKQTILPGIISGAMWGIAQVCWFIANSNLPYVVSYPLICAGPGLLSALWGIVVFKEIRGWKNFIYFGGATIILLLGIVCICVSK